MKWLTRAAVNPSISPRAAQRTGHSKSAGSLTIDRCLCLRRVLEVARETWLGTAVAARHGRGVACNGYDGETHIAYVVWR